MIPFFEMCYLLSVLSNFVKTFALVGLVLGIVRCGVKGDPVPYVEVYPPEKEERVAAEEKSEGEKKEQPSKKKEP